MSDHCDTNAGPELRRGHTQMGSDSASTPSDPSASPPSLSFPSFSAPSSTADLLDAIASTDDRAQARVIHSLPGGTQRALRLVNRRSRQMVDAHLRSACAWLCTEDPGDAHTFAWALRRIGQLWPRCNALLLSGPLLKNSFWDALREAAAADAEPPPPPLRAVTSCHLSLSLPEEWEYDEASRPRSLTREDALVLMALLPGLQFLSLDCSTKEAVAALAAVSISGGDDGGGFLAALGGAAAGLRALRIPAALYHDVAVQQLTCLTRLDLTDRPAFAFASASEAEAAGPSQLRGITAAACVAVGLGRAGLGLFHHTAPAAPPPRGLQRLPALTELSISAELLLKPLDPIVFAFGGGGGLGGGGGSRHTPPLGCLPPHLRLLRLYCDYGLDPGLMSRAAATARPPAAAEAGIGDDDDDNEEAIGDFMLEAMQALLLDVGGQPVARQEKPFCGCLELDLQSRSLALRSPAPSPGCLAGLVRYFERHAAVQSVTTEELIFPGDGGTAFRAQGAESWGGGSAGSSSLSSTPSWLEPLRRFAAGECPINRPPLPASASAAAADSSAQQPLPPPPTAAAAAAAPLIVTRIVAGYKAANSLWTFLREVAAPPPQRLLLHAHGGNDNVSFLDFVQWLGMELASAAGRRAPEVLHLSGFIGRGGAAPLRWALAPWRRAGLRGLVAQVSLKEKPPPQQQQHQRAQRWAQITTYRPPPEDPRKYGEVLRVMYDTVRQCTGGGSAAGGWCAMAVRGGEDFRRGVEEGLRAGAVSDGVTAEAEAAKEEEEEAMEARFVVSSFGRQWAVVAAGDAAWRDAMEFVMPYKD